MPHCLTGWFVGRVTIHTDGITEFSTSKYIGWNAVRFASQVHERHLNRAHTSALPGMVTELFYLAKDFVHVTWILAKQPALQHKRKGLARAIPYFSVSAQALIRINADKRKAPSMPAYCRSAHIRDF